MKKIITALLAVILVVGIAVTAVALVYKNAEETAGSTASAVVDRVNFTFAPTQQRFTLGESENGYVAEVLFTAEKTEPDFYAVLHGLTVSGINSVRTEIAPAADSTLNVPLAEAILPVVDGKPAALQWKILIYFTAGGSGTFSPEITVDFTSGVKKEAADRHLYTVPLTFIVSEPDNAE